MQTLLFTGAILVAGTMTGNELAVSAFVHPQIARLDDMAHAHARQGFASVFGKVMPFWYALSIGLAVAVAWTLRGAVPAHPFHLAVVSAVLCITSLVYTLLGPVRINNQIAKWNLAALPPEWRQQEQTWDRLHAVRVVILVLALTCLILACLASRPI